ncbi:MULTISPECIES: DUF3240 family protein [Thiomicrorhabdus]|uniref:DUF3240 family protein n=1 Tax=Thiomicrorhabdus xiamenensis TaxID=2739063 RepID=A0A7D4TH84_9GAMM|nr:MULTISPECIES: DUF3240 family protein [Thiomicrorhabdus]MBO1923343.1 DUF3240 family protein [Thiomicrorhabdus sp. 6S3-12]QKI90108.1 DUF3240 family protein [Thiomicrorhabdus xiamenensis]
MEFKQCILRLQFDSELYDSVTDALLSYPQEQLTFVALPVQAHTYPLENISEQVSGYKNKTMLEVTVDCEQSKSIYLHIREQLPRGGIQVQLMPLLEPDWL